MPRIIKSQVSRGRGEPGRRGTYTYIGEGPPADNAVLLANARTGDTYLDTLTNLLYQLNGNPVSSGEGDGGGVDEAIGA